MSNPNISLSDEDKARIKSMIKQGVEVETEIHLLRSGLSETVKAIAEELEIKPAILNRAIKTAYKDNLYEQKEEFDVVEHILDVYQASLNK